MANRRFPLDKVTAALLYVCQSAFGLQCKEVKREAHSQSVWHPDVQLFRITDTGYDKTRAYLYLDLFHRVGKSVGLPAIVLRRGCAVSLESNTRQLPVACLSANLYKYASTWWEEPSQLSYQQVLSYFQSVSSASPTAAPFPLHRASSHLAHISISHHFLCASLSVWTHYPADLRRSQVCALCRNGSGERLFVSDTQAKRSSNHAL